MGHMDPVQQANEELRINLGYKLDLGNADQFRTAIKFCGMERFRLCLKLVMLWQRENTPVGEKHKRLLALMRLTAPHHNPNAKYRSPATAAGHAVNDQLDLEMAAAIARDRD